MYIQKVPGWYELQVSKSRTSFSVSRTLASVLLAREEALLASAPASVRGRWAPASKVPKFFQEASPRALQHPRVPKLPALEFVVLLQQLLLEPVVLLGDHLRLGQASFCLDESVFKGAVVCKKALAVLLCSLVLAQQCVLPLYCLVAVCLRGSHSCADCGLDERSCLLPSALQPRSCAFLAASVSLRFEVLRILQNLLHTWRRHSRETGVVTRQGHETKP